MAEPFFLAKDFPGRVLVIIQARLGSKRLPGKVLMKFNGQPAIKHLVEAIAQVFDRDDIVIASSIQAENDSLADYCRSQGWRIFRGDEENVASRFFEVVRNNPCRYFVRICADSPLFDPEILSRGLAKAAKGDFDIVGTVFQKTVSSGMNIEIIKSQTYLDYYSNFQKPDHFEHLKYFYDRSENFNFFNLDCPVVNPRDYKFTLDTLGDKKVLEKIFKYLEKPHYYYRYQEKCLFYRRAKEELNRQ